MGRRNIGKMFGIFAAAAALGVGGSLASGQLVISQIYGGSGTGATGALYQGDYVELFNRGTTPVDITGWSIQYASPPGSFGFSNLIVNLPPVVVQPGKYFLYRIFTPNSPVGAPIGEDAAATAPVLGGGIGINLSSTAGKIALVNSTTLLPSATCVLPDASVVDFLGYGTSVCAEGGTGSAPASLTAAVFRLNNGCADTDNNAADFAPGTPNPRNSTLAPVSCLTTNPSGSGSAAPSPQCPGQAVTLTFTVTPGANPTSTGISVTGDFTAIGGGPGNAFVPQGGNVFSAVTSIGANVNVPRTFSVPIAITDAQGRTGQASIAVSVIDCTLRATPAADPPGVCTGESSLINVRVTPGISPASTGVAVLADLSAIGGSPAQALVDDGTSGDVTAGDNVYSFLAPVPTGTPDGISTIAISVTDAQGRSVATSTTLGHGACADSAAPVVISQVYGRSGSINATLRRGFIELFNRTATAIDLSSWTLQYATAGGGFSQSIEFLNGVIQPNSYFLVGASFGNDGTVDIPFVDQNGFLPVGTFGGKVAIVNGFDFLDLNCPSPLIIDLVSYGQGVVSCFEGLAAMPGPSVSQGVHRKLAGCRDTNNNLLDCVLAVPAPRSSLTPANVCVLPPSCPADFNGDGDLNPDDLGDYINCYFSVPPCAQADFNGDGDTNPDDLGDYINAYFGGCP